MGLGCDDASVSAELYKLLVYDRGGFFLAHRDTEKIDGMFGTLVVTLPSTYRGGSLRIRHAGREVTVDTNVADSSELYYVRSMRTANTRLCLFGKAIAFAWFITSFTSTRRVDVGL